jgi:hypothetical protein
VVSKIATDVNLFDYFHSRVAEASDGAQVRLSNDGSLYLAQLLTDRAYVDQNPSTHDTLAELHARAAHARPAEQAKTWRELGDRALYDLGQCREHLASKIVPLSYYAQMGRAAYRRVDEVLARWFARAFGDLFSELSGRFDDCVRVLDAVRAAHERDEIDALWSAWQEHGDQDAARRLRLRGVLVPRRAADTGST